MSGAVKHEGDVEACHAIMSRRAKTFRWAALLLGPELRDDAAVLYAFCRAADDAADEGETPRRAHAELDDLERGLRGQGEGPGRAVAGLAARRGVPLRAAHELVAGVRRDIDGARVANDAELLEYAYLVAGTVGLMMSALLGARDPCAQRHAIDLGIAMQITNICRDVAEDAALGRVYLPEHRLLAAGTSHAELLAGNAPRSSIARVVSDLLLIADQFYASADLGMRYLPLRCRLAVLVASRMYRAIGLELRRRGCDPLSGRSVVPFLSKMGWCTVAFMVWLTLCVRAYRPLGVTRAEP